MKSKQRSLLAGVLLGAAGIINAHAISAPPSGTLITFSVDVGTNIANGTFVPGTDTILVSGSINGWPGTASTLALVQEGNSSVYTNTFNDTSDINGGVLAYKFVNTHAGYGNGNYESTADFNNRAVVLPTTSGGSLILPTPFLGDDGAQTSVASVTFQVDMSQQIQLGLFTNGTSTVTVSGNFNGWPGAAGPALTWTPSILETNSFGLVTSNVYTGTVQMTNSANAAMDFKYVENGNYEGGIVLNDGSGNRFFTLPSSTLATPVVFFSDQPFSPISQVSFSVDMSAQLYYGNWTPSDGVFCQGINGNWNNNASTTMTNNPNASNTNIYYITIPCGEGSLQAYKFTYNGASGTVYESPTSTGGNNRSYTVPPHTPAIVPTAFFSDLSVNDQLSTAVNVTFSVDMTQAVQYGTTTPFNPSTDSVFVNGAWIGWLGWDPISLASYQLTNNPVGSSPNIYSGTFPVPLGNSLSMVYKYSINGADNEAGSGANHLRIIRSTVSGAYSLPTATFGNQYNEPLFGELSLTEAAGGNVQLSWLGAPNVQVQTRNSISTGSWISLPNTSGATWSAGINTTNGLLSETNLPASGCTFFRLIKQ